MAQALKAIFQSISASIFRVLLVALIICVTTSNSCRTYFVELEDSHTAQNFKQLSWKRCPRCCAHVGECGRLRTPGRVGDKRNADWNSHRWHQVPAIRFPSQRSKEINKRRQCYLQRGKIAAKDVDSATRQSLKSCVVLVFRQSQALLNLIPFSVQRCLRAPLYRGACACAFTVFDMHRLYVRPSVFSIGSACSRPWDSGVNPSMQWVRGI